MSQISYHGSGDGGESDDSEGENQELAQIDRGESSFLFHSSGDYGFDDDDDANTEVIITVKTIIFTMVTTVTVTRMMVVIHNDINKL